MERIYADILSGRLWIILNEPRFGIVYVDYETQKRIIKDSGYWYSKVIETDGETLRIEK